MPTTHGDVPMPIFRFLLTAAILATLLPAAGARAQAILPTRPAAPVDDAEQAAARAAARAFAKAMGEPDAAAVKALFAGTSADLAVVEASRAAMAASARVKASAARAFPADAGKRPASDDLTVAGMLVRVDQQPVKVTGDRAVLGTDGMTLKKVGGQWRVTALVASPTASANVPVLMTALAAVLNSVADDAEAGRFKTAVQMQVALRTRVRAAVVGAQSAAGTRPATGPASRPAGN